MQKYLRRKEKRHDQIEEIEERKNLKTTTGCPIL